MVPLLLIPDRWFLVAECSDIWFLVPIPDRWFLVPIPDRWFLVPIPDRWFL